ncbi:hypothetical protein A3K82_00080 [Candidatus Pacearchaeota archaeon RBG_19FT_COMBO_34_9]|nr:MAG: hypothetical protein A3K82_00080 [Candidatus Pacearchaeota archaeon RBG_19FT_COMBO_34_9]OGJ17312.1 MAG: hypothetical protein A3K74_01645 [Candidatus Pacearchaeota archaeon RBG_13_33_26]
MVKKTIEKQDNKKKESDKGSRKPRTGLPQVNMIDAIDYVKKAYESTGTNLKSFAGMAKAMGISEVFAKRAFGELKDYGLIEQESNGWKISDLGRRVANGERNAVIEILERNSILKTLYSELKDKNYDRDFVVDYVKKRRFSYSINHSLVADRFISALDYIQKLGESGKQEFSQSNKSPIQNSLFLSIIKLKYALTPPSKKEIAKLVKELSEEAQKGNDVVIKSLTKQMMDKKEHEQVLHSLLESLVAVISEKYPSFSFETGEAQEESLEQ